MRGEELVGRQGSTPGVIRDAGRRGKGVEVLHTLCAGRFLLSFVFFVDLEQISVPVPQITGGILALLVGGCC